MKPILCCLLWLCLAAAAAHAQHFLQQDEIQAYTKVGQQMPPFSVTTLDGTQLKMADLKGKVVFINFWATWCGPCWEELPRLEKEIWQKHKSSTDFVMVAIAREQSEQEIAAFRKEYDLSFPMAADPRRETYRLFAKGGIPRGYVVGTDGQILYQSLGYDPDEFDQMKKVVEKALAKVEKAKSVSKT
jgi:peroxiredoxin